MANGATQLSAEQAFRHFEKAGITVTDLERNKDGSIKVAKVKGEDGTEREVRKPVTRELAAADIIGAARRGDTVSIVTIDGRRYTVNAK